MDDVKHGMDINATGGSGAMLPTLHRAVCHRHVNIINLLKNNATVDLKHIKTAWTCSIMNCQWETSKVLLKEGADPNTKAVHGINPIYDAASAGDLDTVKFLLKSGTIPSI